MSNTKGIDPFTSGMLQIEELIGGWDEQLQRLILSALYRRLVKLTQTMNTQDVIDSVAAYHALVTTAERELMVQLMGAGDADA